MATYIIQVIVIQVLFLAVYDFFLSKETFHGYNRWYLLGTPILSFVLPFVKISSLQQSVAQDFVMYFPETILTAQNNLSQESMSAVSSVDYLNLLYGIGVLFFAIVFCVKLYKIIRLIIQNEQIDKKFYKLIMLSKQSKAFSFFHFIFLGKNISEDKQEKIIQHELVHSRQKHSIDLLFFEFLRITMWFNPMIYIYQKRITLLHEYISDSEMVKTTDKQDYFNKLLSEAFQVENVSFVNQFQKQSLIKKRITMMKKNKSNPFKKAKYMLLLPMLASILVYTSCEKSQDIIEVPVQEKQTNMNVTEVDKLPTIMVEEVVLDYDSTADDANRYVPNEGDFGSIVQYFIHKNFKKELLNDESLNPSKGKIYALFTVDKTGVLKDVKVRAPSPSLKEETLRVINMLPSIEPAIKDGKPVGMTFTLPISFYGAGERLSTAKQVSQKVNTNPKDVPMNIVEELPIYPGCSGTKQEIMDCLNSSIKSFVLKDFDASMAQNLDLPSGRKKIYVVFRIDETGNITDVNARAPHPKLKAEAVRVASMLPKMQPARQRGKAVGIRYTLPISFSVK
ncbi:hypothetical protein GCM10011416_03630 [Polaribacter pacificus]|uniref:TonB protein C-terminal n=1 Tax=Polaribacter pacificus TaxID=1775173 RepID=A0A917HU81_9FLAO|nr:M56 family metallopeptidase [Polaribacter pacificus]GGG90322.1 hypothetical protein GCM10011416_03630 [Polaribacter pacificus]